MAKKIKVGNYDFNASENSITLYDNIPLERFLLITNVTRNTIIYNFSNSSLGGAVQYNPDTEETTLSLTFDCAAAGHSDTDSLQIFVQEDSTEFTPSEDLIDPVGKFRVSNPENLIDTDFEYSLQGTKWETIQTVNNIPTVYSSSGDIPIEGIESVEVTSGSKQVKVTTSIIHTLNIGDPISVQGLDLFFAEGFFIVSSVPDSLTFFFELDVDSNITGDISGSYTTIIAAKFFEGSPLPISIQDGAITDALTPSSIDIKTQETHGFSPNTKVYLRNSIGPRTLTIDDSSSTAPDGRPIVDTLPFFTSSNPIDTSTDTGRGLYNTSSINPYDWEPTYSKYILDVDVNATNNTITWTGHGLNNRYTLLFNTPIRGDTVGGLSDGRVYWAEVVDENTIKLHTNDSLTAEVDITTWDSTYGLSRLGLVYRIISGSGSTRTTEFSDNIASSAAYIDESTGSSSSAPQTFTINLSQLAGQPGTPISGTINISRLDYRGDFSSSTEYVDFWPLGQGGTSGTLYRIGSFGGADSSAYRQETSNGWPSSLDITSVCTTNGSNETVWTFRVDPSSAVNFAPFGMPNFWWWQFRFTFAIDQITVPSGTDFEFSGADLYNDTYGLGGVEPDKVIAFQGVTPGSYSTFSDQYSRLVNQRTNGRYGSTNAFYNAQLNSQSEGILNIDYNNTVSYDLGSNSQVFYIFTRVLTADRNTIYIQDHGIDNNSTVTITVNSTDYAAGQRFVYANSTGSSVTINDQVFTATVNVVSPDLIRLQVEQSPFTDDVIGFPNNFTIDFNRTNQTYNSIYIGNHKITGSTQALYTQVGAAAIGGLTSAQNYLLNRLDDARVTVSNIGGSAQTATTAEVGAQNNNTQTLFIDFETALGFAPTAASITSVEFRGDFSSPNEYVLMRFTDGTEYFVGQRDGQDTDVWLTDTTWSVKNVTDLLVTDGGTGNIGLNVEFDPTSPVNAGFFLPSGNFWEIRFVITADSGTIVLSATGSGEQIFEITSQTGAYDGIYTMDSIPAQNEFILTSEFTIPKRTYEFTSADLGTNTITFSADHNLITGEKIVYDPNGNTSMLPTSDAYHAIVINSTTIAIASSFASAINNSRLTITSQTGTHRVESSNIIKNIKGNGSISVTSGSNAVTGSGTRFLTDFKRFDQVWIEIGGYARSFTVDQITTNENMTLFENSPGTGSSLSYYFATQIILRPDGYSLHKPFDGGVDITAGTSPNSKIVRQSRKYFRYQSGKGIQNSYAINFNPPKIIQNLIQASGTTATVNTQEAHNFNVGDQVRIEKATVSTGTNTYNGTFAVSEVLSPFSFSYEMDSAPSDTRAGGFPTYTRVSWNDSFIRAGMFDDQNGFFYEYDGQNLYAVRRSSTLQLAGTINVSRGSQVITGNNTSFTTQLSINDKIVVRGQSYLVVEVSSDNRIVVQPAYRGISASKVKITKTIDTRVPQSQWNIDPCDGTGPTGYILDLNRIQMAYADYSWYGAGKVRLGFKDQNGHVRYVHEFRHNNRLDESYFRSGNLPARYEIENGPNATTAPTLFHFGTSIIMDGRFDNDKAYLFSSSSRPFAFTNGASRNVTTTSNSSFQLVTLNGTRVFVYAIPVAENDASATAVGSQVVVSGSQVLPTGTYVTQVKVDGANSLIYTSWPATATEPSGGSFPDIANASTLILGEQTAIDLTSPIPLLSLRLAPSVDSGLTGGVGQREVINRMQLGLRTAGVTSNGPAEIFLILNATPSNLTFRNAPSPSLSQLIQHGAGDTLINGTTIFSQKSSTGSVDIDLTELLELGNSILGGDGVYPAGPDLLTLAIQPQDTSQITGTSPFFVSGKINWSESQA